MKQFSFYISSALLTLSLVLGSCKKLTEGLDVSPNSPTDAPLNLVLNGAQVSSILIYEGNLARFANVFSRSFSGVDRQYVSVNNYNVTAPDFDDTWDNLYASVIAQAKIVEQKALAVNNKIVAGISQVMEAQAFGLAADLWGDVPFTEAGDPAKFPSPKFDAQADVYKGVQSLLDQAITNLSSKIGVSPGAKDIFYAGDVNKWVKAAHTLKARFYLHVKDYNNAVLQAGLGILNAADNMMARHGSAYLKDFNVYYSFLTYDRPAYINADGAYAPSLLDAASPAYKGNAKTNETARYNYLYQQGLNTSGLDPNVLVDFDWGNDPSQNGFFGASTSFPLVTFEENILILAEANIKLGNFNEALNALNTFRAYMNNGGYINTGYRAAGLKYEPYQAIDFLPLVGIANPGGLSQNEALLMEILKERYVTLIGQIEQFNDVRRTKNKLGIPPITGTKIPQRFFYPQSEINTNRNTPKLSSSDLFKETPVNTTPY